MWHRTNVVVAATVALLAWSGDAPAQTRKGFWFGAGGGYGAAAASAEGASGERKNSGVGYLQGGHTLNEHLLVGGEFGFWSKKYSYPTAGDYARVGMYSLTGTATYYPQRTGGLFVKGGAGMAFNDWQVNAFRLTTAGLDKGFGLIGGGGYDIAVGAVAITPAFNWWYGWLGDQKSGGETFANHKQSVMTFTVGITIP
jgi:outer membrane protein with beta-barrel domain